MTRVRSGVILRSAAMRRPKGRHGLLLFRSLRGSGGCCASGRCGAFGGSTFLGGRSRRGGGSRSGSGFLLFDHAGRRDDRGDREVLLADRGPGAFRKLEIVEVQRAVNIEAGEIPFEIVGY